MDRENTTGTDRVSLAQLDELEALKERYACFDSGTLERWMTAVTGTHKNAMAAVLRDRGALTAEEGRG